MVEFRTVNFISNTWSLVESFKKMQLENYNRKCLAIATIAHWGEQNKKRSSESPSEQPSWQSSTTPHTHTPISMQISASWCAILISSSYSSTGISASATSSACQRVLNSRCPSVEHPCYCSLVYLNKWFALQFQSAFEMYSLPFCFINYLMGTRAAESTWFHSSLSLFIKSL